MSKRKKSSSPLFKTYKSKIVFYTTLFFTLVYCAGYYFAVDEYQTKKIQQTETTIKKYGDHLKIKFGQSLAKKDTSLLAGSVNNIKNLIGLDWIVATNYKGEFFYYFNIDKAESDIYLLSSPKTKLNPNNEIFKYVLDLDKSKAKLYMGFPIKSLQADIGQYKIKILPYLGGAWLLSFLFILLFSIKIFKPLKKVVETTKEIIDGDYTKRIKIKDRSELGRIGKAINYLTDNLEEDKGHIAKMETKLKGAFKEKIGELNLEINQRRIAEKSVRLSEKQFRLLFDAAPIGMAKTSVKGKISQINKSFCETLGYEENDLLENNIDNFIVEEDKKIYKDLQNSLIEKTNPKEITEICFIKQDGKVINALLQSALVEDDKGLPIDFILQVIDITYQKQTERNLILAREKAEESDRLKTAFLAQMSHEIRTPLNVILNATVIMEDEIDAELLEAVNQSGKRLQRTIDLILNMSAIQSGSYEPEFEKIDLGNELRILVNEFKGICKEKNLDIEYVKDTDNSEIVADNYTVMQIFQNLINNAVKYTPKGKVKIILKNGKTDSISVEVKDTGIGISEEYLENIFKPFSQEDVGQKREFEGNGLGLALVKKYVDLNKAEIFVESKKDEGSTFRVVFKRKN